MCPPALLVVSKQALSWRLSGVALPPRCRAAVAAGRRCRRMRLESFVKTATLLGVGALLLVGQGLQPQAAYPAWVSASDAAQYASAAAEMANGAAEVAYSAATEAASSVTEAASSALGLQNDGEDPNALALAGFHASRADLNKQLQRRIQAAAAAATGQAPAATASTTASVATASTTASVATPTPPKPVRGAGGSVVMEAATPTLLTATATAATAVTAAATTAAARATPTTATALSSSGEVHGEVQGEPAWLLRASNSSALLLNAPARAALSAVAQPAGTTLHFTFGSAVMMDFVKNWLHFVKAAGIGPYLVGASDVPLLDFCNGQGVPAAAISPDLDVWTHTRRPRAMGEAAAYELKTQWQYYRHHNSDFLEMGLVKVAFLYELVGLGFDVLISDLDVVWLNGHWQRWMSWDDPQQPPLAEAAVIARADILVSTDELSISNDLRGARPHELNTGVLRFRGTQGSLAFLVAWRGAMSRMKGRKDLTENVNDQALFNQIVRGRDVTTAQLAALPAFLKERGRELPYSLEQVRAATRRVYDEGRFTFATLPIRPFASGHTWFNQGVQEMEGHELPQHEPVTVHFTYQFGDTNTYPHGKRQRAREAALWAVDPPEYFTEGVYVAIVGPTYTAEQQAAVYRRFPEWSPQRHMFMDAPQRQAVRDLLGLASTFDGGVTILPKLYCHIDRYWGLIPTLTLTLIRTLTPALTLTPTPHPHPSHSP